MQDFDYGAIVFTAVIIAVWIVGEAYIWLNKNNPLENKDD